MTLNGESSTGPAESETLCMRGRSMLENRDVSKVSRGKPLERLGKVSGHNPNANIFEKSDTDIVPEKEPNKVGYPKSMAEVLEEREVTKGKF